MTQFNVVEIKNKIFDFIEKGCLEKSVIETLSDNDGFIPIECELWDYKKTLNKDRKALGKTVLQIVSFYNTYGGYIIYGVDEKKERDYCIPVSITASLVDEQQVKALIKEYTGDVIGISYREFDIKLSGELHKIGIVHVPKRMTRQAPIFFCKDGPEKLFSPDSTYIRLQDNCKPVTDRFDFQFLFGERSFKVADITYNSPSKIEKTVILDNNLPDRALICSKFFGRDEIIKQLWIWLSDDFSRVKLLAGEGGRGKTSIAYEFAEEVCRTQPYDFQRVLWLTAKKKQFKPLVNEYIDLPETHFNDFDTLLGCLCIHFALIQSDYEGVTQSVVKKRLREALTFFPTLIVIDDIDSIKEVEEQKKIVELSNSVSPGSSSRFLLTTRQNLISSADLCISVPGLVGKEYQEYVEYLCSRLSITVETSALFNLQETTGGSPLFTESLLRLCKLGMPLKRAINEWKGRQGEDVREAALISEIDKLSVDSRRLLLACSYMGEAGASSVELKGITGFSDGQMEECIKDLRSFFLISEPEFVKDLPRFKIPKNTALLVVNKADALVYKPENLLSKINSLNQLSRTVKSARVGGAIAQAIALLQEDRFDEAIATASNASSQNKNNPDLKLLEARCYYSRYTIHKDKKDIAKARKLFKEAYDLGNRKEILYDHWYYSEKFADGHQGAMEVSELALKDDIGRKDVWLTRHADSSARLAYTYEKNRAFREAHEAYKRGCEDIRMAISNPSVSQSFREKYIRSLNQLYDYRQAMALKSDPKIKDLEESFLHVCETISEGDDRVAAVRIAIMAFKRLAEAFELKIKVNKSDEIAVKQRYKDIVVIIKKSRMSREEKSLVLDSLKAVDDL